MQKKLLIVDDDPINLASMRSVLKDSYSLTFATGGKEAMRAMDKHRPDLVLLDIDMPEVSGYEVCQWITRHPQHGTTPVIFLTSHGDAGNEEHGFEVGASDFLTKPISPSVVKARIKTHLSLVTSTALTRSYSEAIHMLGAAGHYNDTDTGAHIWRLGDYSAALAEALGWSPEARQELALASTLHDVGKIGVPDSILRKPGKLDAEEWVVMRGHPRIGYEILARSVVPLFQLAADISLHHHEKWEGSGYPEGLRGEAISEASRIVAIADVFDALTTKRPYKEPWPVEAAFDAIAEGAGKHFDPQFAQLFLDLRDTVLTIREKWRKVDEQADAA